MRSRCRTISNASAARDGVCEDALLRVALRSQPVDAAGAVQPFIDLGLGLEALDVADFLFRMDRLDLPVAFRDPLQFENDARFFAHDFHYAPVWRQIQRPASARRWNEGSKYV